MTEEKNIKPGSQLISMMAREANLDANAYASTVMKTCFAGDVSREQFLAFLMVAQEHKLNPITREIYGFEKGGKIQPIVSIDGWLKIINERPEFNGMQFEDHLDDDAKIIAVTCKIYRTDRDHPTIVTEYLAECHRDTAPWNKWPIRMLRHKATIQCARYSFGFSGIVDADEAERIKETSTITGSAEVIPEDKPESATKRLVSKLKPKVQRDDFPPETVVDEATGEIVGHDVGPSVEAEPEMTEEHRKFIEEMEGDDAREPQ